MVGSLAPEIVARGWVNSLPLSLANLRGQVVLLNFLPLHLGQTRPEIEEMARDFAAHGLRVVGVQDAPEYQAAFRHQFGEEPEPPLDLVRLAEVSRQFGISYALALDAAPPTPAPTARGRAEALSGPTSTAYNEAPYVVINRVGRIAYAGDSLNAAAISIAELLTTR